jgi:hypothetical protein
MIDVIVWIRLIAVVPAVLQSGILSHLSLPRMGEVIIDPNTQIWSTSVDGPPSGLIGPDALGALVGTVRLIGRPDRP